MKTFCEAQGTLLRALQGPRWEGNPKKGIMGIHITDSLCCTPKANTTLSNNHVYTLWTVVHQAPLSMGFSRQEHWSGLPCPSPEDLPDAGIKPASRWVSCTAGKIFTSEPPGKPKATISQ